MVTIAKYYLGRLNIENTEKDPFEIIDSPQYTILHFRLQNQVGHKNRILTLVNLRPGLELRI